VRQSAEWCCPHQTARYIRRERSKLAAMHGLRPNVSWVILLVRGTCSRALDSVNCRCAHICGVCRCSPGAGSLRCTPRLRAGSPLLLPHLNSWREQLARPRAPQMKHCGPCCAFAACSEDHLDALEKSFCGVSSAPLLEKPRRSQASRTRNTRAPSFATMASGYHAR
jgi:hypothetical protein